MCIDSRLRVRPVAGPGSEAEQLKGHPTVRDPPSPSPRGPSSGPAGGPSNCGLDPWDPRQVQGSADPRGDRLEQARGAWDVLCETICGV